MDSITHFDQEQTMAASQFFVNLMQKYCKLLMLILLTLFASGCQTGKSPEEVTKLFWRTMAQGQTDNAKQYVTQDSQHLVNLQDIEKNSPVLTGEAFVDDDSDMPFASVPTTIMRNKRQVTFDTMLTKERDLWKINYVQTQLNITMIPLSDIAESLQNLGGIFARQLEQQLPMIQKQVESFGNQMKQQLDELGRSLEKPQQPGKPPKPRPGTI